MSRTSAVEALAAELRPLASRFDEHGFELYLVGGIVRDLLLATPEDDGRPYPGEHTDDDRADPGLPNDVDLTTDARPDEIVALVRPEATALWRQGERFGTIGAHWGGHDLEITTYRSEIYEDASRQPSVTFGDDLIGDLARRDFTINAMAVDVLSGTLVDPHDGAADLAARRLRTPLDPATSFTDDPLRLMRAARFIPRFGLTPDQALEAAATRHAERLSIVSAERIRDEFEKLLAVAVPTDGFVFLARHGLLPALRPDALLPPALGEAAARPTSAAVRRAAFFDGRNDLDTRLEALRYSRADRSYTTAIADTATLLLAEDPTPSLVRRVAHRLARFDVSRGIDDTVDLARCLAPSSARPDGFARALAEVRSREDLDDLAVGVSGSELMAHLGLSPGPAVGSLLDRLLQHRLDHGPMTRSEALALAEAVHAETG